MNIGLENIDSTNDIAPRVSLAVEQLIDEISFLCGDQNASESRASELWRNLQNILLSLKSTNLRSVLLAQRYLMDILLFHCSFPVFQGRAMVWKLACRILLHILTECDSLLWQITKQSPQDVANNVLEVASAISSEKAIIPESVIDSLFICLHLLKEFCKSSDLFDPQLYAHSSTVVSNVLHCLEVKDDNNIKRISILIQRWLFTFADSAVQHLLILRTLEITNTAAEENFEFAFSNSVLPLGGTNGLFVMLCAHCRLFDYPIIVQSLLQAEAALCSIPITDTFSKERFAQGLLDGLSHQHNSSREFLSRVTRYILDNSANATMTSDTNCRKWVTALAGLCCSADQSLCNAARGLMAVIVSSRTAGNRVVSTGIHDRANNSKSLQQGGTVRIAQIFSCQEKVLTFGLQFLSGFEKFLMDLQNGSLLGTDRPSLNIVDSIDEILCWFVDFLVVRTLVFDLSVAELRSKVCDILGIVSKMERPVLSASLVVTLERAKNCNHAKIGKVSSELLLCNEARVESASNSSLSPTVEDVDVSYGKGFVTQNVETKHANHNIPSNPATFLDRLELEEQAQAKREREELRRKRIYGEAQPSCDQEDRAEADHSVFPSKRARDDWSFLSCRPSTKEIKLIHNKPSKDTDDKWQQQLRELKEAKLAARLSATAKTSKNGEDGTSEKPCVVEDLTTKTDKESRNTVLRQRMIGIGRGDRVQLSQLESGKEYVEPSKSEFHRIDLAQPIDWRSFLGPPTSNTSDTAQTSEESSSDNTKVRSGGLLIEQYLRGSANYNRPNSAFSHQTIAEALSQVSIDHILKIVLNFKLNTDISGGTDSNSDPNVNSSPLPIRFLDENHYIDSFQPLLINEIKEELTAAVMENGQQTLPNSRTRKVCRVRCVSSTARAETKELREVTIVSVHEDGMFASASGFSKATNLLIKDDLVLVFNSNPQNRFRSLRELVSRPHSIGLVVAISAHAENSHRTNNSNEQITVAMLGSDTPQTNSVRYCVPLASITTALREWSAIMSIRNSQLMPLAPYLLKGSPVVSAQTLSSLHESIIRKVDALCIGETDKLSGSRTAKFNEALTRDLEVLSSMKVDGSVLKNTGIAKTLKRIVSHSDSLLDRSCAERASLILTQWKDQVKKDHKSSTLRSMKGGNLISVPIDGTIDKPSGIPDQLWARLADLYNRSQLFAIKYISDQFEGTQDTRIALVQGPPGTGKTFTVLGMVSTLLLCSNANNSTTTAPKQRLLICAPSNTAIDELLTRLSSGVMGSDGTLRLLRIVRLGEPLEGSSSLIKSMTLDSQIDSVIQKDPIWTQLQAVRKEISDLEAELDKLDPNIYNSKVSSIRHELFLRRQGRSLLELRLDRLRNSVCLQILGEADLVGSTLSGSGRRQFLELSLRDNVLFDTVIIDEAAQSTEPSCLVPLRLGCRRLVLVGDPRQLPATVHSNQAIAGGLSRSLFERLERAEHEVVMLTIQYRMHPEIRRFPSLHFYQNLLTDSPGASALPLLSYRGVNPVMVDRETSREVKLKPVTFLNLWNGTEISNGTSFSNHAEAQLILKILTGLLRQFSEQSIAVIAPYKAQVHLINRMLKQDETMSKLLSERHQKGNDIDINTVDGFQGREKDIVIFTAVRARSSEGFRHFRPPHTYLSNPKYEASYQRNTIGFVADERRINVAITRAKVLLVVIGNASTLSVDQTWWAFLRDLYVRRIIKDVDVSNLNQYPIEELIS